MIDRNEQKSGHASPESRCVAANSTPRTGHTIIIIPWYAGQNNDYLEV